jgi:senataxin
MAKLREKPWHKDPILGPYRFFDVQGQQTSFGSSLTNKMEIDAAMRLYNKLMDSCPTYDFKGKIGIITPYKAQFNAMKRQFQEEYGKGILDSIEFNTTDAFQGRECEIIIFSCVRASEGSIGFLNDYRRMNVGLTRAKCSLWVLGNTRSLVNGKDWKAMIEDAQRRNKISPAADIGRGRPSSVAGTYRPIQNPTSRSNADDGDVKMGGISGVNSSDNSRHSSVSSTSAKPKQIPNGPAKGRMCQEDLTRLKSDPDDVEMKDIFSSEDEKQSSKKTKVKAEVKEEGPVIKHEKPYRIHTPGPPSSTPGGDPGHLVPRPPAQMPAKRRKAPVNPLLEHKRPKKH